MSKELSHKEIFGGANACDANCEHDSEGKIKAGTSNRDKTMHSAHGEGIPSKAAPLSSTPEKSVQAAKKHMARTESGARDTTAHTESRKEPEGENGMAVLMP